MITKIPKPLFFIFAFLFGILLYMPAMSGTPIWDDYSYWFENSVMQPHMSYWSILTNFGWPISVIIQKFLFSILGKNFVIYHLINYFLHFINSLLVYRIFRLLKINYSSIGFLFFLLHPTAVMTTAWMIQIKTLLCFFFAFSSIIFFIKGEKQIKWLFVSWPFFFLSVGSKSASLTLPFVLFLIHYRYFKFKHVHYLLPYFIISLWGTIHVLKSPVTQEGSARASLVAKTIEEAPKIKLQEKEIQPTPSLTKVKSSKKRVKKNSKRNRPTLIYPKSEKTEVKTEVPPPKEEVKPAPPKKTEEKKLLHFDLKKITQVVHYYFWQAFLPIDNHPVKGLNYNPIGWSDVTHLFFLFCMIFIFFRDSALLFLISAHLMILPFIGLVPAPYMSVTWVSDQHLYLALPALIGFWMRILGKINFKQAYIVPLSFLLLFSFKTFETTKYYKNQFIFYEKSLDYNPTNVPIIFNLALARAVNGELISSYHILNQAVDLSQTIPQMKKSIYYPHLINLYFMVNRAVSLK